MTLATSVKRKERAIEAAAASGAPVDEHERARKVLHSLVHATNNRMHKGFPEMLSYLMKKPIEYSSHAFVSVMTYAIFDHIRTAARAAAEGADTSIRFKHRQPYSTKIPPKPFLTEYDYLYRPDELENFPLYFFFAGCEARLARGEHRPDGTLPWHVLPDGGRQCTCQAVCSQTYDGVPLRGAPSESNPLGPELFKYAYYVSVRLTVPWRVPVLHGILPLRPEDRKTESQDSSVYLEEQIRYAIYLTMLFRPFRSVEDVLRRVCSGRWHHGAAEYWKAFLSEFRHWRVSQESIAAGARRVAVPLSEEWWACRVCDAMKNYDVAAGRHLSKADTVPSSDALHHLPFAAPDADLPAPVAAEDDQPLMESDSDQERSNIARDSDDTPEDGLARNPSGRATDPVSLLCGSLPEGFDMNELVNPAALRQSRSAEAKYVVDFIKEDKSCLPNTSAAPDSSEATLSTRLSANKALIAADKQAQFFKFVDKYVADPETSPVLSKDGIPDFLQRNIDQAVARLPVTVPRSRSSVVEAAFFLLENGVLNVPVVGGINVKQARALLWNAVWLQDVMNREWELHPLSDTTSATESSFADDFQLALMGPGGTGKTAVLRVVEALICYFCGPDSVRKCAPSNSAARLIGGDTIHALCKLPFGQTSIRSKKARLSIPVLGHHRRRWQTARACFIDEVSMVKSNELHAVDVRLKQAKNVTKSFGGLGVTIAGDWLQLPPVDPGETNTSLAVDVDDSGVVDDKPDHPPGKETDTNPSKLADVAQGLLLWKRVRHVVCLDVNIRAPGPLSRLLAEMRDGNVSPEMWELYCSRVMTTNDQRLSQSDSPFSQYTWQFIVHRHKIRVYRSLENARAATSSSDRPLYIVQAMDEAVHAKDERKMPHVREQLLRRASPRDTQALPGILPLYVGMRLTLQTKERRRTLIWQRFRALPKQSPLCFATFQGPFKIVPALS